MSRFALPSSNGDVCYCTSSFRYIRYTLKIKIIRTAPAAPVTVTVVTHISIYSLPSSLTFCANDTIARFIRCLIVICNVMANSNNNVTSTSNVSPPHFNHWVYELRTDVEVLLLNWFSSSLLTCFAYIHEMRAYKASSVTNTTNTAYKTYICFIYRWSVNSRAHIP